MKTVGIVSRLADSWLLIAACGTNDEIPSNLGGM